MQLRHYDFGLRNILSVLRTAGVNLRIELRKGSSGSRANLEEMLLMRTLRDMNLSKLGKHQSRGYFSVKLTIYDIFQCLTMLGCLFRSCMTYFHLKVIRQRLFTRALKMRLNMLLIRLWDWLPMSHVSCRGFVRLLGFNLSEVSSKTKVVYFNLAR